MMDDDIEGIMDILIVETFEELPEEERRKLYIKARDKARELYEKKAGNQKAELWVCFRCPSGQPLNPDAKIGKCFNCKAKITYDPEAKDRMIKGAKKICGDCVLKTEKFNKHLTDEEKKILKGDVFDDE